VWVRVTLRVLIESVKGKKKGGRGIENEGRGREREEFGV